MTRSTALILGARSDIAGAISHKFASEGYSIQLAARHVETLWAYKADIELRYAAKVSLHEFDVLATHSHEAFIDNLPILPNVVICVVGFMGEQTTNEKKLEAVAQVIRTNFEGPASIFTLLASRFETRGSGTLVGISSVAGLRGRASNYIYGSAKAGFTAFLSGLRNWLAKNGIHVVTLLPGFVATRMTQDLDLPKRLTAQPVEIAEAIWRAVENKKNVVYVRPIWRVIMFIICAIPENIFKRTNL